MVLLASTYDQSRFFKAADLTGEKKLKIKSVTTELVGMDKDKEEKLVVWFTTDVRGLVLNRVNNRTLRGAFGDDTAGWSGRVIVLFPTTAEFRGKMGPALRVRIPPPKQAAAAASPARPPAGNGGAVAPLPPAAPAAVDPELEPDPKLSAAEEMDDSIDF